MKNSLIVSAAGRTLSARSPFKAAFSALFAAFISVSLPVAVGRAQTSNYEADGEEVLTRGPVHEAFAAVVSYNPEPGIIVKTRPPELIEELPPEEKPEGDDVAWIPGYWGWDDERNDYLWISGTWRVLPPGREWMAGYWREGDDGYQWISGYWADAAEQETTYLPPPPATLETGANIAAPSDDYGWSPGYWDWRDDRYAWRAGYWAQGRADWVWVPAYYVWTPRGVIFVAGFWDYPVERRGVLFAPVYYQSHGYARRGYSYSPRIAINLSGFLDNLFLRPSYHHYYFGDYYGSRYEQGGFYASIAFQSSRQGFDPFYSHNRWEHRSDRGWENRYRASYQDRRDHEAARPPRTWDAQVRINASPQAGGQVRIQLAAPFAQLARNRDNPVRYQSLPQGDRQRLARQGRDVQQSRDQRRTVEARPSAPTGRNAGATVEPARVTAPRSPFVGKPSGQRGRNPAPPQAQQAPQPGPSAQPRAEAPGRQPGADRRAAVPAGKQAQPAAEQRATAAAARAQEDSRRKEQETQAKARQDDERSNRQENLRAQAVESSQRVAEERAKGAADAKAREESERKAEQDSDRRNRGAVTRSQTDERSQQQAEERRKDAEAKAHQEDSQRNAEESQRNAQQALEKVSRDAAAKSQAAEKSQQEAIDSARAKQQGEERANASAAKAKGQSQGRGQEAQGRAQQDAARRANDAADKAEGKARTESAAKEKAADEADDDPKKDKERSRGR